MTAPTEATGSENPRQQPRVSRRAIIFGSTILILVLIVVGILGLDRGGQAAWATSNGASTLTLAVPAFIFGILSFLSPCTLPILPAYFAFTFQASKRSIVLMSVAFFLGLATTMTLVGASLTAVGSLVNQHLSTLTLWGGILIVGFGLMTIVGKGFSGPQIQERPATSFIGSYLFGATFTLGWTACAGPILGALFTLLASQGIAVVQGAVLSFIYALGLGLPLMILAAFFSHLGTGSRFWKVLRGKGFAVPIGSRTLYLHTTSIISGALLVVLGLLLATDQLTTITTLAYNLPFVHWLETWQFRLAELLGAS